MEQAEPSTDRSEKGGWSTTTWLLFGAGAMLFGLLAGWAFLALQNSTYTYKGTVIESPVSAGNFTLIGPGDEPVNLNDFRGKAVLLYFGYTFCPDVCPTTLVELAEARQLLGRDGDKMQVLMVTVDPARDTVEQLEKYTTHFDPSFIGLTGSEDEIAAAATRFGIYYEKQEGSEASGYLMDHTASVIALDPEGNLRLIYPYGTSGEDIADDIKHLLR